MNKIIQAQQEGARRVICDALARTNGRPTDAAKILGTTRQNFNAWAQAAEYPNRRLENHMKTNSSLTAHVPDSVKISAGGVCRGRAGAVGGWVNGRVRGR